MLTTAVPELNLIIKLDQSRSILQLFEQII